MPSEEDNNLTCCCSCTKLIEHIYIPTGIPYTFFIPLRYLFLSLWNPSYITPLTHAPQTGSRHRAINSVPGYGTCVIPSGIFMTDAVDIKKTGAVTLPQMSELHNLCMVIPRIYTLILSILFMGAFVSRMLWYFVDVFGCLWKDL